MWVRYPDMADCLPGWAVIDDLDDLRGPAGGVVSLPVQLYWGATSEFDLDQPGQLRPYLQAVLREALNEGHLASYI
ncbi:MAG: hypothetical protein LBK42_14720, partial [Propionibacteriaceae bacterium]|nr:hypothetical protein [Propionibacteriaceae bacterium]